MINVFVEPCSEHFSQSNDGVQNIENIVGLYIHCKKNYKLYNQLECLSNFNLNYIKLIYKI